MTTPQTRITLAEEIELNRLLSKRTMAHKAFRDYIGATIQKLIDETMSWGYDKAYVLQEIRGIAADTLRKAGQDV